MWRQSLFLAWKPLCYRYAIREGWRHSELRAFMQTS